MNKTIIYIPVLAFSFIVAPIYPQDSDRRQVTVNNVRDDNIFYHLIERGQTIYSIAVMYGVDENDLYRLNPDSREIIKVGDRLRIPQKATVSKGDADYLYHTIQAKETLYSLSVKYNVPAADIVEVNPGLSVNTFLIGKNIRVPSSTPAEASSGEKRTVVRNIEYKVERRETLYRIARKFNVPSDEILARNPELKNGVKAGMILNIPVKGEAVVAQQTAVAVASASNEREANALLTAPVKADKPDTVKLVLLLPFMLEEHIPTPATAHFVEYYEGLLLAVDSLRVKGVPVRLTVRDCGSGTAKVNEVLKEAALRDAHLIIGALENNQIAPVAAFAKNNGIKYVIPFTSNNDEALSNSYVFQVNTPHSYLHAKATQAAYDMFFDYNIIFVETEDRDDKAEFISMLKQELSQHKVAYKTLTYQAGSFYADIESGLRTDKRNVIIPTSATLSALNKIRTPLRTLVETRPEYVLNLFGYPEWQTYVRECLDDFFILNTYIYTKFYADNLSPGVARFYAKYKVWYSKNPANIYPKYALFGFDTGMFFLDAVYNYGVNFEANLSKVNYKSLQTGFKFYRVNNWGGFVNMNLFIVHYNRENYRTIRHELQ
ncbi:MAG: LysM peptidoglycan-binding domain-containing protein [Tannerellaceae bacterium]|jgi:LysM repeat protein|nr:LysM peptidoglycan-binding domain-containing protein [Tannerellaceae bacterium]